MELDIYTEERFRFSQEEVSKLLSGCVHRSLRKNEAVYDAEAKNDRVYYLLKGKVKYHVIYPDGSNQTTAYTKGPTFLGIINLMPDFVTVNHCTTITPCEICVCPIELFLDRLREYDMMEKMLLFVIGASRHIYNSLSTIISEDRLKLVDVLRNHQKLTLQETADFIGCSRVHVSRICKQLDERRKNQTIE